MSGEDISQVCSDDNDVVLVEIGGGGFALVASKGKGECGFSLELSGRDLTH